MDKTVRNIYEIYENAEQLAAVDFSHWCLQHLHSNFCFDSSAITSFIPNERGEMALASQIGQNVDSEKVRLRHEILGNESIVDGKLQTPDPLLKKMVLEHNTVHTCHVPEVQHTGLRHYAKLSNSQNALGASTQAGNVLFLVSAWRAKPQFRFGEQEIYQAAQVFPHALKALTINRKLSTHPLLDKKLSSQIYCLTNGDIIHYDEGAIYLLRQEFPYWLAGNLPYEILSSIHTKSSYCSPKITIEVIAKQSSILHLSINSTQSSPLTKTEIRVVEMVVKYNSLKKVALEMGSSVNTIRNQVASIYKKLGITSKIELANHYHKTENN